MRCLIVEDDRCAQKLMLAHLSSIGTCDCAENGHEAIAAFTKALDEDQRYDLICLDIMMPHMNGHQTLAAIRKIETEQGIYDLDGVKIIMTTALRDRDNVFGAFRAGCEAYLVKPVRRDPLFEQIEKLGLLPAETQS